MMKVFNKNFRRKTFLRSPRILKFSTSVNIDEDVIQTNYFKLLKKDFKHDQINEGGFHQSIAQVLFFAQFFGLMPVIGIKSKDPADLNFQWMNFRSIYSILVFISTVVFTGITISWAYDDRILLNQVVSVMFYLSSTSNMVCFIKLAKNWPNLMIQWYQVERTLPPFLNKRENIVLSKKIRNISILVLTLSLIEHSLSILSTLQYPSYCPPRQYPVKHFFEKHLPYFFYFIKYSPIKAVYAKVMNIFATVTWSYANLFVILISVGLSSKFRQLNDSLFIIKGKPKSPEFWSMQRVNYRSICSLCENIDDAITIITMITFSNNLFFICVQLLYGLNQIRSLLHGLYFWFSLLYLIGRTLALSLCSANIHAESNRPLEVFRAIPRESWCQETRRFSDEVTSDTVALSGMKFFYLTRGLVLTVAGTIVTYELVLIQFHDKVVTPVNVC